MPVVALISAVDGVGKTTLATYLADRLLGSGDVLLVDLDPSAGLSVQLLGEEKVEELERSERTIGHAMGRWLKLVERGEDVRSLNIDEYIETVEMEGKAVSFLPGGDEFSNFMNDAMEKGLQREAIRKFLEDTGIVKRYSYVILDTVSFCEKFYTLAAFYASDKVIIVTHPYSPEPARVKRMFRKLKAVLELKGEASLLSQKARILMNNVDDTRERDILEGRLKAKDKYRDLISLLEDKELSQLLFRKYVPRTVKIATWREKEEIKLGIKRSELKERFNEALDDVLSWLRGDA
ncbi:MAG: ParA family protein [Pyrobaculum sp.]